MSKQKVKRPRVQKEYRDANCFNGRYKQHDLQLTRVGGECVNWYIRVRAPSGLYAYDGYWLNSAWRTVDDAITEACTGACLWTPNTEAPLPAPPGEKT